MSKQKEIKEVQGVVKYKKEPFLCDICQKKTDDLDCWDGETYSIDGTKIEMTVGNRYPGAGWKETTEFHICPDCFKEKLIPFFESHGAKATESETVW